MPNKSSKKPLKENDGQWQLLQIYNISRAVLIIFFCLFHQWQLYRESYTTLTNQSINLFNLAFYFFATLMVMILATTKSVEFSKLVFGSSCIDIVCLNISMILLNSLENTIGVAMNVATAALAIMLPGIAALCFAAFETLILFAFSFYQFLHFGMDTYFINAVHGAGIFVTAATSLFLGNLVQKNYQIATLRQHRIIELEKINKFIIHKLQSIVILVDDSDQVIFLNRSGQKHYRAISHQLPCHLNMISEELFEFYRPIKKGNQFGKRIIKYLEKSDLVASFMIYSDDLNTAGIILIDNSRKMLQQAQQLKLASLGRFTASIAHELRNPLGAISHANQLLGDQCSHLSKQQIRLIEIISNNCDRMNNLIKNILQLSRQQRSKPSSVYLSSVIEKVQQHFQQCQFLSINAELSADLPAILFDQHQIHQLLVIFIENAINYGKDEMGHTHITFQSQSFSDTTLSLLVFDTGSGIDIDKKDQIFEPFYTTSHDGTGLGLFLAKEICTANQATVEVVTNHASSSGICFKLQLIVDGLTNE